MTRVRDLLEPAQLALHENERRLHRRTSPGEGFACVLPARRRPAPAGTCGRRHSPAPTPHVRRAERVRVRRRRSHRDVQLDVRALVAGRQRAPRAPAPRSRRTRGRRRGATSPARRAAGGGEAERCTPRVALPVLFWLPETRLGVGATGGLHFHAAERGAAVEPLRRRGLHARGAGLASTSRATSRRRGARLSRPRARAPLPRRLLRDRARTRARRTASASRGAPSRPRRRRSSRSPAGPLPRRAAPRPAARGDRRPRPRRPPRGGRRDRRRTASAARASARALTVDTRDGRSGRRGAASSRRGTCSIPPGSSATTGAGRGLAEGRRFLPLGRGRVLGPRRPRRVGERRPAVHAAPAARLDPLPARLPRGPLPRPCSPGRARRELPHRRSSARRRRRRSPRRGASATSRAGEPLLRWRTRARTLAGGVGARAVACAGPTARASAGDARARASARPAVDVLVLDRRS